jgi:acetyltransferase-like isoleucine patch superfamily enzyme
MLRVLLQAIDRAGFLSQCMRLYQFQKVLGNSGRREAWRVLGCKIAANVNLAPRVHMRFPERVTIGAGSSLGSEVWIDSWSEVTIGANCFLSHRVHLLSGGHLVDSPTFAGHSHPITIGDYVWMPRDITVLPGVTIGDHAVIGTGAVVTKDVPPYGVAVGNPARVVKKRARIPYTYVPSDM